MAVESHINELSCQLESAIGECSNNGVDAFLARFRVLSHLTSVVVLLVAWDSVADLGAWTLLRPNLWASQIKVLPKDIEEQICCVGLLALQNEVQSRHSRSLVDSIHGLAHLCIEVDLEVVNQGLLF